MAEENISARMPPAAPIYFGKRLAGSDAFRAMFREGMGLVEETANYLDGEGRRESKGLARVGSLAYATESMRLTTRLMQLASWLLLQRAVNDGELSAARAVAVVRYLADKGIPPEHLAAAGFGEFQPLEAGDSDEQLAKNRRIELKLTER